MKEKTPLDLYRFKEEVMHGLYIGKSLSPNGGILAPVMKHLLQAMMYLELANHLQGDKASGNINRQKVMF